MSKGPGYRLLRHGYRHRTKLKKEKKSYRIYSPTSMRNTKCVTFIAWRHNSLTGLQRDIIIYRRFFYIILFWDIKLKNCPFGGLTTLLKSRLSLLLWFDCLSICADSGVVFLRIFPSITRSRSFKRHVEETLVTKIEYRWEKERRLRL